MVANPNRLSPVGDPDHWENIASLLLGNQALDRRDTDMSLMVLLAFMSSGGQAGPKGPTAYLVWKFCIFTFLYGAVFL